MRIIGRVVPVAAAMLVLAAACGTVRAQAIDLKVSHFLPPVHGIHKDFIEPWARELETRTNGKVKVTVYAGNSTFGNVAKQYDQVAAGVIDIGHGLTGVPRGRFPRTSVIDMPFLTQSADAATRTLWALLPRELAPEYKDVKVLALHAHNGGLIHTAQKQVRTAEDLRGLRIRFPSPAIAEMLKYLGATPVGLPPGQVYENLQTNAIDGTVFPWDPVNSFKLAEVLKYHLDARAYTVSFFFVMNRQKYEALPAEVRQAIDAISGDALVAKFGPWWTAWDKPGLEAAKARGNAVTELTPAERERWAGLLAPMTEQYLAGLKSEGVEDPQALYKEMQRLISEFEKKP